MANESKLTTLGQMAQLAQQQDARDDAQEARIEKLEEGNDSLKYTSQTLTDEQKSQARSNIGAAASDHTHARITEEEIDAILSVD